MTIPPRNRAAFPPCKCRSCTQSDYGFAFMELSLPPVRRPGHRIHNIGVQAKKRRASLYTHIAVRGADGRLHRVPRESA